MGPAASQIAIKQLGTNGGGFFNANSAVPFENPTPFSNFLEVVAIFLIPAALTYTFGKMVGNTRQGWAIFAAMSVIFLAGVFFVYAPEQTRQPDARRPRRRPGVPHRRRCASPAATWRARRSASASPTPRSGRTRRPTPRTAPSTRCTTATRRSAALVPLFNMHLGEVVFGGVGSGLYGMLVFAIIAVFIAGLMIGRTPEYLGKKIGPKEMKLAGIYFLITLGLHAAADGDRGRRSTQGQAGPLNAGAHGYSEILYAFTSAGRQQRLRVRRPDGEHVVLQHDRRHHDARGAVPAHGRDPGAGRRARAEAEGAGERGHAADRTRRCSSASSSASSSSSAA